MEVKIVGNVNIPVHDSTINNIITEAIELPIRITASHVTPFTFYVTLLDSSCSIVLGYNWLTRHNPLIDWVLSSIIFPASCVENPISEPTSLRATILEELETTDTTKPHDYDSDFHDSESHNSKNYEFDTSASMNPLNHAKIDIALVNAVAYQCACQLPGSQSFSITLSNGETSACSAMALALALALALAENRSTSPVSPKNTMTSPMCSVKLKPTNYHLIDLMI